METQDLYSSSFSSSDTEHPSTIKSSRRFILSSSDESSDTSIEVIARRRPKCRRIVYSFDSECEAENIPNNLEDQWIDPTGHQPSLIPFMGTPGTRLLDNLCKEEEFYLLFITEEIFEDIAEQTNIYATQILSQKRSSRLNQWIPTNKFEIKKLFGLLIWMGLVKLPEISLYWSKNPVFAQSVPKLVMSRNRFELLLRMLHFVNNENANIEDRLYKIAPIIQKLKENYAKYYNPPEIICIDESIIPFRGRKITPKSVAVSLCENIFDKGHTLCVDNWYTSIDLAQEFLARNTHVIGTIRSNRRKISKEVVQKKLQRGEVFAKENRDGITLMKWKDKRDVLMLSTKHSVETVTVRKHGSDRVKPKLIVDYNDAKSSVDISDQMTAYCNPLRKTLKWYKKNAWFSFISIFCCHPADFNRRLT
ncbi:hypothetical protein ACFW04_013596 [Cataglyphis niger]